MMELFKYFYCGFDWCQAAVITNNSSHFVLITKENTNQAAKGLMLWMRRDLWLHSFQWGRVWTTTGQRQKVASRTGAAM